jgi:SAM-dependent MidA family methyltransferase
MTPLSPEEEHHSRAVAEMIRRRIKEAGGWLPFDTFMDLALYAPGLGYYSAGGVKLGAGGDFVTAPELSDLFSACVARQCVEIIAETGGSILELGAGTGRMAATILQTLNALGVAPERYAILEVSADLRARQQQRLGEKAIWLDRLPQEPWRGVVLANEVLDALPCERFVIRGGAVRALGVSVSDAGAFTERERPASNSLVEAVSALAASLSEPLGDGYRSEVCLRVAPWISGVAEKLERGAILLFDYGLPRRHYYHPQRTRGTLRCHFKHRVHDDPLINVGVQDITAWVDFTHVAEAADAAGLQVHGFTTQTAFLLGTGIERLLAQTEDAAAHLRRASEARQLMLPGEMGEAFKAMAVTRNMSLPFQGFGVQDLRQLL